MMKISLTDNFEYQPHKKDRPLQNVVMWFIVIAATIFWVSFKVGGYYTSTLFFLDWYNLILLVPIGGALLLNHVKDPTVVDWSAQAEKISQKKESEVAAQKKRGQSFNRSWPRLTTIPILGGLMRWGYKEGIVFSVIFLFILVNAFFIRVNNVDILPLQNDEFLSQIAVQYILDHGISMSDLQYGADSSASEDFYSRALPYSLGAALTTRLLGGDYMSYYNLRLFSVIAGILFLFVFYLLVRRYFSKTLQLLSLFSLSSFYLFVYYSRVARMYSLHLFLFFLSVLLFVWLFSKIESDVMTSYVDLKTTIRYFIHFIKKNYLAFGGLLFVWFIDIQTHYTGILFLPIILLYFIFHLKRHRQLFYPIVLIISGIASLFILYFMGVSFIGSWYGNMKGDVYWRFLDYTFSYLSGGYLTVPLFLFPLFFYKKVPSLIKLSYAAFFSVVPLYVFVFNGSLFGDPRYMIFIYPFYILTIVYSLYVLVSMIAQHISVPQIRTLSFGVLLSALFVLLITPLAVFGVCQSNAALSCPISHTSRIFNLDRWNYNHDAYFKIIKENLTTNSVILSRSIYDFYIAKYDITAPIMRLSDPTKDYVNKGVKFTIPELEEKDLIFIDYPHLAYYANLTDSYNGIYHYLLNHRDDKQLLYQSGDGKVFVYRYSKIK
ncbi:MAG: hypothetical protein WCV86_03050 [Patescibacteria group bacterium]|jgi:hypothetical protein